MLIQEAQEMVDSWKEIGYYNPITEPAEVKINEEKATKWLNDGAQPTDVVKRLFDQAGLNK